MCLIDGTIDFVLVPHVYRQEVYNGKIVNSPYHEKWDHYINKSHGLGEIDKDRYSELVNTSPVNFFAPKLQKFPNFKNAQRIQKHLEAGDCIFIPAYYYYQFKAENKNLK
jgi:hypothetical protein